MKFALLGEDPDALQLVRAVLAHGEHRLVAVYEAQQYLPKLYQLAPAATSPDHWESLLHGSVADVVIVGHSSQLELRAEQLRKLVQAAIPLLLVQPACESIVAYELDMIRRDTGCVLVPYLPEALHPGIDCLARLSPAGLLSPPSSITEASAAGLPPAAARSIGTLEQLVMERRMPHRTRQGVLDQFSRDVEVIRRILGDITKIGAMGGAGPEPSLANLSVHMSGSADILARWSVGPVEERPGASVTLLGSEGKATLIMPADSDVWKLEMVGDERHSEVFPPWDPATAALENLAQALRTGQSQPNWQEASRDVELAETIERSLRRGRTIEIYEEAHTEGSTFKGMMAAGGCGLLMLALAMLLVAALVEGLQLPFRTHFLWRLWPVYLFLPFLLFLLLQLLQLALKPESSQAGAAEHKPDSGPKDSGPAD